MSAGRGRTAFATVLALGVVLTVAAGTPASGQSGKKPAARRGAAAETVLVRLGNETITPATVQKRLDELPENVRQTFASPEGKQRLLERMVEERVWLLASTKKGVGDRPEVKRQLEQQRRDLLIRTYVNELMAANPAPSDSEARAYYDAHTSEYALPATVTLSHVMVKSESDAKKVKQWATSGQDWKKLVEKYSVDSLTRANGGVLGTSTKDGVYGSIGTQPSIAEAAFALGAGKIGGPIHTDRGWHVIKVDAVREASTRPFEQVRGGIVRQIGTKRQQDFYNERLEEARKSLNVRADSTAIKSFVSMRKSARDLFNEAQAAGPPAARIDAYRKLLEEYPDSDVSPQARFMIGFIQSEELKDYDAADRSFRDLLQRHPKSELAASAQWMVDHMRTEGAPEFMNLEGDSAAAPKNGDARTAGAKGTTPKP